MVPEIWGMFNFGPSNLKVLDLVPEISKRKYFHSSIYELSLTFVSKIGGWFDLVPKKWGASASH